jgi:hypothetical protein
MLPRLNVPLYDAELPSGTKVTFRPFLVKEEKMLLIAKASDDATSIVDAVKQVLHNCLEATPNISVDKLPLFDVEYLFLQLRARSIGEIIPLRYRCNKDIEGTPCGTISQYEVDLLAIKPVFGEGHSKQIELTPTMGLLMTYPTFKSFTRITREDLPAEEAFAVVGECVEAVYDADNKYYTKDAPPGELKEFIDSLSPRQVTLIDKFFDTLPKIQTTIPFLCPKCGNKEDIVVEGLDSFFV